MNKIESFLHLVALKSKDRLSEFLAAYRIHIPLHVDDRELRVAEKVLQARILFALCECKLKDAKSLGFSSKRELMGYAVDVMNHLKEQEIWRDWHCKNLDGLYKKMRPFNRARKLETVEPSGRVVWPGEDALVSLISKRYGNQNALKENQASKGDKKFRLT
ncbi:MAG: hypothetical protein ACK5WO_16645 [Cyclobacteriaceae bacterium]|jgi:hypothetical protein